MFAEHSTVANALYRCILTSLLVMAPSSVPSASADVLDESYDDFGELKSEGELDSRDFCFNNVGDPERFPDPYTSDLRYPNLGAQRSAGEERIWYVSASATGANTGESWDDAFVRLENALIQAQGGDELWVARGKYVPIETKDPIQITSLEQRSAFIVGRGVKVYGGFEGGELSLDQRNPDPASNGTELSGDLGHNDLYEPLTTDEYSQVGVNSKQIVVLFDPDNETVVDGFTISGGAGTYGAGVSIRGDDGQRPSNQPRLENLRIIGNYAQYRGAGLDIEGGYTPMLDKVSFIQNEAQVGGGLYSQDTQAFVLDGLYFEANRASFKGGGAYICIADGSSLLKNSLFRSNSAFEGGALAGALNILNSRFESNEAGRDGGAFHGRGNIHSSVFRGNSAERYGGALFLSRTNRLANLLFTGNVAGLDGGAILAGLIDMQDWSNLTFTGNRAERFGGAIRLSRFSESNRFTEQALANSILANNAPDNVYVTPETFGNIIWRNCLLEGSGGSGEAWDDALGVDGGGNLDADPLFFQSLPPEDAPTVGGIYRVVLGSPVLDSGNNALLARDIFDLDRDGNTTEAVPFDLTGISRRQNGIVDMGAFEGPYPNRYPLAQAHAADIAGNGTITLSDLLRVIQFFNSPGLHCDEGSEDGYAVGVDETAQDCAPHSSDYNPQDWQISLSEVLRAVQIFNTGAYFPCAQGEDGFCVGAV